jgi:hypothetical protein
MLALFVWLGLTAGSVLYQITTGRFDWPRVVEVAFFQGGALLTLCLVQWQSNSR